MLKKTISLVAIVYFGLRLGFSESFANFLFAAFLVALIPFLILRKIFLNNVYKNSISIAQRQFVAGDNMLRNDHCTVKYTPDEKLIVMENIPDRENKKRMFTLSKTQLNINEAWNRLCRVFDTFITIDTLISFYNYDTKVEVITIEAAVEKVQKRPEQMQVKIDRSNLGPKIVEFDSVKPDSFGLDYEKTNEEGKNFVAMNDIQEVVPTKQREQKAPEFREMSDLKEVPEYEPKKEQVTQEYVEMSDFKEIPEYQSKDEQAPEFLTIGDIMNKHDKKMNINAVEASEIAILPGVNIVMAKKIIEYRNTNGLFKTVDDFINTLNVKEHFIPKIREMIYAGESIATNKSEDNDDYGRIVDF